jgi:hypothetical protein
MIRHGKLNRKVAMRSLSLFAVLVAIFGLAAVACGVESGDRRPARQGQSETLEFHRTPVTAFEQFRIDIAREEGGDCSIDPNEVTVQEGQRVRLAIQLPIEIAQGATKSLEVVGEKQQLQFKIDGLEMSASGGAFGTGKTAFDIEIGSGARKSYDFNAANTGAFDMLCDGTKVGTFTVNPSA